MELSPTRRGEQHTAAATPVAKHNVGCAATAASAPSPKGDKAQGKRRILDDQLDAATAAGRTS